MKKQQMRTSVDIEFMHFFPMSSEQNFTQTIILLEDPGTRKSSFVIMQGVPFASPSDSSIFTQIFAGKPSPIDRYLWNFQ